ncbi:hypothetical protein [Methanobrevibacter woesei]|uniref:hypothetical protein n=1 Tax=Methanobrevibacter woesei TaxID=190976 RepID=UPI00255BC93C|nr:hypothetical protein [Methanobrevibacter woesei]
MNYYLLELANKILKYELDLHLDHYEFLKSLINEVDIEGEVCVIKYNEFNEVKIQSNIIFINKRFIELINKIKCIKRSFKKSIFIKNNNLQGLLKRLRLLIGLNIKYKSQFGGLKGINFDK